MADVQLIGVHKAYGATAVVKGISLRIESGEFISLLGPSGCGKTTTLRMIAGLETLDAGTISIGGELVDSEKGHVPPEKRALGMVFQSYAVWPHKSVAENVAYPLLLQRKPSSEIAQRVTQALEWVRLGAFAQRMPSQLSGGQLQRVAIARALVANPRVLLLDEPLSNLDAALREELRGEIAALRARLGTTMIFVTHDQHEALALSDRVAVMHQGVIEQIDSPQKIYQSPSTPFVAGFVGGANRLEGRVEGRSFICGAHTFELPERVTAVDGPATLAVRAEELELGSTGPSLPLLARLFLGSATEFRFTLGESVLRVVGPARDVKPGESVRVALQHARLYPR
ncbi:MAG: ABC transporter ATP-binding protein [Archangium sp.]|nr:ABC transporter ATP-binding protein [Archangium sp.]MDP3152509.1 ABC transporter ATP-binding protein [Archangium sp.]MDP3572321.1 ABC transporter ATP-binding protein [Archangium sp.]